MREIKNFVVDRIKGDRPVVDGASEQAIEYTVRLLLKAIQPVDRERFVSAVDWIVPVPGHSLHHPGALWPSKRIAEALQAAGVGNRVEPCLVRKKPVQKSAWAKPGERPTARMHYESFAVETTLIAPTSVLLVDDVVTRGATLVGGAARISEAFPDVSSIQAMTIARTDRVVVETTQQAFQPLSQTITYDARFDSTNRP